MHIGSRRVRSAGKASGSIEITLPPELTPLEGVVCNILLRDGARPEIVLKPELTPAALIFARVWNRLRVLLSKAGEIGEFPVPDVDVCLLPSTATATMNGAAVRPTLVYSYALLVGQGLVMNWPVATAEFRVHYPVDGIPDTVRKALAGLVYPLACVAGSRLGLVGEVTNTFGHVVALLALPIVQDASGANVIDGLPVAADGRFEVSWSQQLWLETCGHNMLPLGVLTSQTNDSAAQLAMQRIVSQFRAWQEHPERRQSARIEWLVQIPDWFIDVSRMSSAR